MSSEIRVQVGDAPPAKDGGTSIRNPSHSHFPLVLALLDAMKAAMSGRKPLEGIPVKLSMHYWRGAGRADALNAINGVADIIQKRCHPPYEPFDVWVIDDDSNIREFHYTEEGSGSDRYELAVAPLE